MSRVGRGVAVGPGHPLDLYMRVGIQSKNYCETTITIGEGGIQSWSFIAVDLGIHKSLHTPLLKGPTLPNTHMFFTTCSSR